MFLRKIYNQKDTLSFRLTLWYTFIFSFTSLLALSIFYFRISSVTMGNTDSELMEEIEDFIVLMDEKGLEGIKTEIALDIESEDEELFYRILTKNGQILLFSGIRAWDNIKTPGIPDNILQELSDQKEPIIETLDIPSYPYQVRTIYGFISPNEIIQIGLSLEDNEEYLQIFRNLLLLLILPLFIFSAFIGWFLSRKALRGVEEVTLTAIDIAKGEFEKRVTVKRRSHEVDRLANTFNLMLDRIQILIKGMREMSDNIAHDLRSPLARIRGIAEMTLLGEKELSDYQTMAANTIEECDSLIEMINTMLDISETKAGISEFQIETIDLYKLILDACELFKPIADNKQINIVTILPQNLSCNGDKKKLQRLVTNLLENSIKYTKSGGTVSISAKLTDGQVNIIFEDTGIGIPEKDLPRIFERFYRGEMNREKPGVGLGLSLAEAIAGAFGGDIKVESVLNKGSSFLVTLPQQ